MKPLLLASLFLLLPLAARADVTVDGAVFPATLAAGGQTLALNGVGVRVFFHLVDGYATALYLRSPAHTADAVLDAPDPKAIVTHFLHDASLDQIHSETQAIHRRYCAHATCADAEQAAYALFVSHLGAVHRGDTQLILLTATGVELRHNDQLVVTIPDPAFGVGLLRSLVGDASPTGGYRRGVLGVAG